MIYLDAVPENLERSIRRSIERNGIEGQALQAAYAAFRLAQHFLGPERAAQYWNLIGAEESQEAVVGLHRLQELGRFIFFALGQPDPRDWLDRLRRDDIDKNIQEVNAASYFVRNGYRVIPGRSTGTKTMDFDFSVHGRDTAFNVEVSEPNGTYFTPQNLLNNLKLKRTQLPRGEPNVIFCVLSHRWHVTVSDWFDQALRVVEGFLRNTQRISCVMLSLETYLGTNNSGNLPERYASIATIMNERASHPLTYESLLGAARLAYEVPFRTVHVVGGSRRSDFERWFVRMLLCEERRLAIDPNALWTSYYPSWP